LVLTKLRLEAVMKKSWRRFLGKIIENTENT